MPIQNLNRNLKQYFTDIAQISAHNYLITLKESSKLPDFQPILRIIINLQFGEVQFSGDINQYKVLLDQVDRIVSSIFIITDLSFEIPNVYYDMGFNYHADKEMLLEARRYTGLHFDVVTINRLIYLNTLNLQNHSKKVEVTIDMLYSTHNEAERATGSLISLIFIYISVVYFYQIIFLNIKF